MHHLGQEFIGNEDQPLMFKFTPWGKRPLVQPMSPDNGKSQAPNASALQASSFTPSFSRHSLTRLLLFHRHPDNGHMGTLNSRKKPDLAKDFRATSLHNSALRRLSVAQADFENKLQQGFSPLKGDEIQVTGPHCPQQSLALAQFASPSNLRTLTLPGATLHNPDGLRLPPMPRSHIPIQDILTGVSRPGESLVDVYSILTSGDSDHTLRPRNPTLLRAYADAAQHAIGHAAPRNTQSANRAGWKLWVEFLAELGGDTSTLRQPAPGDQLRERLLKALFLLWCRTKCVSSIPGRTTLKPSTILDHLYAVKRVHEANGLEFLTKGQTTQAIKFLAREYELVHGAESLIPHKREGFTPSMVKNLLRSVDGLKLPSRKVSVVLTGSWLARNVKAAIALCAGAGFRRSEVSVNEHAEFTAMGMSRASLFFIIQGQIVRCPSNVELRSMAEGDLVGVLACPTKNDPLGIHFMPFPIILAFHPLQNEDPGATLRDLALHCPVATQDLRCTPLFTMSRRGEPLGYNFLSTVLTALLPSVVPAEQISNYSWHSFRIGLACALRAAKAPDWVLLALLRWRSPSSIPGYGRVSFETAASWLDQAAVQEASSLQATNLPYTVSAPRDIPLPNALSDEAYSYLDHALSQSLLSSDISNIHASLPQFDDDGFVTELSTFMDSSSADDSL